MVGLRTFLLAPHLPPGPAPSLWPRTFLLAPLTFPLAPSLSRAAGEEGGMVGLRTFLLASAPFSWPPSPSPWPPSSPALRERKGEGVTTSAFWRPHLPPGARTCLLAPASASWPPHLPPGPLPSRAAGEEGGRRKGGWNMACESMLAPLTQWLHRDETCPMRRLGFLIRFSGRVRDNAWLFVCHCDGMGLSCGLV